MKTVNAEVWKFAAVADKLLFLNAIPSVCLLANCNIVIAQLCTVMCSTLSPCRHRGIRDSRSYILGQNY